MAKQEKFITSHRSRVKRANQYVSEESLQISIFDREAIVEFYLLEDILRLYQHRLKVEEGRTATTRAGQMAHERNITMFNVIIDIFTSAIEVARAQIDMGNYTSVWKAIPEHQLATAANNVKNLPVLRKLSVSLLKEISNDMLEAIGQWHEGNDEYDNLEIHEGNVIDVRKLPTPEEINQIIEQANAAIPDVEVNKSRKAKPNANL